MTTDRTPRTDRAIVGLFDELASARTPDYFEAAIERASSRRQRPSWTFPERWIPMADIASRPAFAPRLPWRTIGVALILMALLIALAVALVGTRQAELPAPFGPAANGSIPYVSGGDIYIGDPVSGQTRLLVGGPEEDVAPRTSPDGTRIAFNRVAAGASGADPIDIYVVGLDGSGLQRITPKTLPYWRAIAWTPDGRSIAVAHPTEYPGDQCAVTMCFADQLDLFDAAGSGSIVTLARGTTIDSFSFRPPDGRQILIFGDINGSYGLYVMETDGTDLHPVVLATDPESNEFWGGSAYAADGDRIFYTRPYAVETATGTCCDLWVMNADGSDQHQFIPNQGTAWNGGPDVSPDGSKVAFWNGSVAVARADGTGTFIKTGPVLSNPPSFVWAPDSSTILMHAGDDGKPNSYLLDPDGGDWTTLSWASDMDIDWQRVAP